MGGSIYVGGDSYGKGSVGPIINHLASQKVGFRIDGGNVLSYRSWDSSFISHTYNDRYYASYNIREEDYYGPVDRGEGGVSHSNTHLSSKKDCFGRDKGNW